MEWMAAYLTEWYSIAGFLVGMVVVFMLLGIPVAFAFLAKPAAFLELLQVLRNWRTLALMLIADFLLAPVASISLPRATGLGAISLVAFYTGFKRRATGTGRRLH